MSSPLSSPYRRSPRLARKTVPEGSDDFRKALDATLKDEEERNDRNWLNGECECQQAAYADENTFENLEYFNEDYEFCPIDSLNIDVPDSDIVNNNRVGDKNSKYVCHIRQCQKQLDRHSPSPNFNVESVHLSEIRIVEHNGSLLEAGEIYSHESEPSHHLKFPEINQAGSIMGTTCSSNFYDRREWHNVAGKDVNDDRGRKRSKFPGKRPQSLFDGKKLGPKAGDNPSPETCTCAQSNSEKNHKYLNSDDSGKISPRTLGVSESRTSSRSPSPQADYRKDKNSHGKKSGGLSISGHSKLSRVSYSKKHSSSSKPEVSPHRLLVRRSYSPQSRINSVDRLKRNSMNNDAYRQRSQSWSKDTKIGEKPSLKASSPPTLHVHSPERSPEDNLKALSPSSSKKSLPGLPADRASSPRSHEHWCPHFTELDKDKLSVYVDYLEDDVTPISRRRAVSESHTSRAHLKTSRKGEGVDQSQGDVQQHVHWADEERGSSLSTSVFLSSIRPRSYSHGAMGNTPQRPILKKVTGF